MKIDCLKPTIKSGQSSTSIWGAFFGTTKIPIVFLQSGGTVLKGRLVETLVVIDPDHKLVLREDNCQRRSLE
jgi:hypothetical protein